MKLVIFDLDQTLVDVIFVHNETTKKVFRKFFNVDAELHEVDFGGKSLFENFINLGKLKGIRGKDILGNRDKILKEYDSTFIQLLPKDATKYILPGVKELLEELSKTENIIGLYTGGSPNAVKAVFEATGLGNYFKLRHFGTESETRADMVRQLVAEAEKLTGKKFIEKDIVIIGDSIRDAECGQKFRATTISVITGFNSADELSKLKPDYIFKDLSDYKKVLKAIG